MQRRNAAALSAAFISGALIALSHLASARPSAPTFTADEQARGASADEQKGYDIAARSDRTDLGFGDSEAEATMLLRNAAGQQMSRRLAFRTLEKESEQVGDKSLVVFASPQDVEGTALLSHAQILEPDDQWLYLPALKRVKRISSANKSGPFVGSEFAFEDFTITELNKFAYRYIGEETYDGMRVDVVDRMPRYERSGYARQRVWVDQEIYQPRKLAFYDRKGDLLKTLLLTDYRAYDGVWRAHKLAMTNHQTGKSTDLVYEAFRFNTGLGVADFSSGVLTRLR